MCTLFTSCLPWAFSGPAGAPHEKNAPPSRLAVKPATACFLRPAGSAKASACNLPTRTRPLPELCGLKAGRRRRRRRLGSLSAPFPARSIPSSLTMVELLDLPDDLLLMVVGSSSLELEDRCVAGQGRTPCRLRGACWVLLPNGGAHHH